LRAGRGGGGGHRPRAGYATGRGNARQPLREGLSKALPRPPVFPYQGCYSGAELLAPPSVEARGLSNHTNSKEVSMKNWRTLTAVVASVALLAGCTSNPYTGEQQAGKVGVYGGLGAVAGAAIGAATSSKEDRKQGALIGAAVGGLAAGGYGAYVDQQEAKLRQTLVNSGVQVQREGDNLILIMPGNITFASSSADISAGFYDTLNSLVLVFKEFNKNGIQIVGHTDST